MNLKRLMAVLLTALMLLGGLFSNVSLAAAPGSLKVFYSNNGAGTNSNQLYINIKLRNLGTSDIDLSKLTIRYYFTKDSNKELKYYSDYVSMGSVSTAFYDLSPAAAKADKYIEIKPSSGTISTAGAQWPKQSEVNIQGRVARSDWSNFDQSNDHSYMSATSQYVENPYIAVFESGTLIAGTVPGGVVSNPPTATKAATPTKSAATPTRFAPTPTKSVPTPTKSTVSHTPTPVTATSIPSKGEVFVTVDKTTAAVGNIIKATINVKDFDVIAGYQASLKYDPTVLQPVYLDGTQYDNSSTPEYGTLLQKRYSGTDMAANDLSKGILTFGRTYMALDSYKASGVKENNGSLAIIGFKVLKTTSTRITLENTPSLTNPVVGTMVFDWNGTQLNGYTVTQAAAINSGNVATPTKSVTPTKAPTPTKSAAPTPTAVTSVPPGAEVYVTVDKTTAAVGDIIKTTISVKGFDVVAGYQANIKYDPTVLQPVYLDGTPYDNSSSPEYGTLLQKRYSGTDMASNDITKGILTFGRTYMALESYKASGVKENTGSLAIIGFKVLKVSSTKIMLENASSLTNPVSGTMVFDWNGTQLNGYTVTQASTINSGSVATPTRSVAPTPTKSAAPTPTAVTSVPPGAEVYVTVDKTTAAVGDIIKATISVKGFDVVAGYQANIKYDTTVLQPVYLDGTPYDNSSSPEYGTLLQKRYSGTDMASNDITKGTLTFGRTYMALESYKASGVKENAGSLAIIGFKVLKVSSTKIMLENASSLTNPVSGTMVFDWNGTQLSGYAVTQAAAINSGSVATPTRSVTPTKAPTPTPTRSVAPTSTPTKSATPTPTPVPGKGEVYLTLDKTTAAVGDIIAATLNVKGFDVVSGYQANIKYDPSVLQPVYLDGTPYDSSSAPDYGTLLQKRYSGTDMAANDLSKGSLTFGRTYMNLASYKNSGVPENTGSLAVIGFKVLKAASTKITLENSPSLTSPVNGTMIFDWDGLQLSGYKVTQAASIN
ncbi:cohesin domain-containing protein [Pseudobacteroides cellulosolvens]|uniref:Cellulosome anchoring protein cohesin region n=1 Tax=Pseudobacteroides cellulosolvens ATCC 35603 = DSM 2933 TaxID=398512 RepID=A0A0L6JUM1_9FIRM|nr:cohesin domain-containing protein [Pseudobacteroides cellulosolvens]KNY29419.1 cellulosome anchoring protein cohesin region [Pseudobacteroides cellulosolvens ATCC 35603 = DSM 2933]